MKHRATKDKHTSLFRCAINYSVNSRASPLTVVRNIFQVKVYMPCFLYSV